MLCLTESAPFTTQEISITGKGKVCGKLQNFIGPLIQVILADFAGRNVLTSGLVDGHADCIDVIDVIEELQSAKGVTLHLRIVFSGYENSKTVLVVNYVHGTVADENGMSTDAGNRDKVLKATNSNSVALKYKDIAPMKRAERSALVKGMDVVYIYHDKVDEASHTSDSMVFSACDDAIEEIKNIVRIIRNEFSGTRVYITADHGFLYTYSPLSEDPYKRRQFISASGCYSYWLEGHG